MSKKWEDRFIKVAEFVATWSKDPERKVGAVVVDFRQRIIGIGYNGLPWGVRDLPERLANSEERLLMSVHAEVNAVLNSSAATLHGATMYSTSLPCSACAGVIVQAGVKRIVAPPYEGFSSWNASWGAAITILEEAGVEIRHP